MRRSGRSQVTQAKHEQREADAIAQKADQPGGNNRSSRRKVRAAGERQRQVDRSCDKTLEHGDLNRIGRGQFPGEIVVYSPARAKLPPQ